MQLFDVGNIVGGLAPIGRSDRINPVKDSAIHGIAASDKRLHQNASVFHGARQNCQGHRCGQRIEDKDTLAAEP